MIRSFLAFSLMLISVSALSQKIKQGEPRRFSLQSPDKSVHIRFVFSNTTGLAYQMSYNGIPVFFAKAPESISKSIKIIGLSRSSHHGHWKPVLGERSVVPDNYNELNLSICFGHRDTGFHFILRAYNEGIGLRCIFPKSLSDSVLRVVKDTATGYKNLFSDINFPNGTQGFCADSAEAPYRLEYLKKLDEKAQLPLTVNLPNHLWACIANGGRFPFSSQWKAVLVADKPGKLLEHNYLILNLNAPDKLTNVNWIKPGIVIREVTLSTKGAKKLVDFAVNQQAGFIEFDAGWYGNEFKDTSNATRVNVDPLRNPLKDLDLPEVISYAKAKGIGVILYVNRKQLEKQIDTLLPLYQKWGIAGLKFGFVHTKTLQWDNWLYEAIKKAAMHHLMVDVHDEYVPTGFNRTYPNLVTQEGVRGNEEFPDATHNTTLPFVRYVAGAADYTPCFLDHRIKNTKCHQLALPVIYFSPWQFLYFYSRPEQYADNLSEIEFWKGIPTVWDQTDVPQGWPGKYAVVVRRKGSDWYIGGITNNESRQLTIATTFLPSKKRYQAEIYEDGPGDVVLKHVETLTSSSRLPFRLKSRGGVAIHIRAITN